MQLLKEKSEKAISFPIGIIGCKGKMGSMLMKEIGAAGFSIHGIDIQQTNHEAIIKENAKERTGNSAFFDTAEMELFFATCRYIIICVPVNVLKETLLTVAPYLIKEHHVLMDITSVKALPMEWMESIFDGQVIGSHPLFGPVHTAQDKKVALVKGQKAEEDATCFVENLFTCLGCNVFWTTAKEHDTGVAFAQSLNFTVSAAFFCTLARHEGIRSFLTPSFKRHLEAARKHLTQDTKMFLEFSSMNPYFQSALENYRNTLAEAASGNLEQVAIEAANWYEEK